MNKVICDEIDDVPNHAAREYVSRLAEIVKDFRLAAVAYVIDDHSCGGLVAVIPVNGADCDEPVPLYIDVVDIVLDPGASDGGELFGLSVLCGKNDDFTVLCHIVYVFAVGLYYICFVYIIHLQICFGMSAGL